VLRVSSRRTLILIAAVVVGGLAAVGLYTYVNSLETEAYGRAELVDVWVVDQTVPKGTTAEVALGQGLLVQRKMPANLRPVTAVIDPYSELSGLVAVTDLPIDAPVVGGYFVAPAVAATGITNRLEEEGLVTFTLSVDDVRGVAGMLAPGDEVNIMVTIPIAAADEPAADEEGAAPTRSIPSLQVAPQDGGVGGELTDRLPYTRLTRMVYQKVKILAIGNQLAPDLGEGDVEAAQQAASAGVITLAVTPEAAMRLAALDPSEIYLSLVPKSYEPQPLPPFDPSEFLPGETEGRLTPYPAVTPQ
jgi:Flp pilus assembly protein CpaB